MPDNLDKGLLNELFGTYRGMMFKIAMGILHNRPDAEDAIQDVFLKAMNNLATISQIPPKERAFYFSTAAENASINIFKKKNRRPSENIDEYYELASSYSVEQKADEKLMLDEIKSALTALSDRDYGIIYMFYFRQMTPKEIAKALDISEKNIHKYIERAKKRFRKILKERGINYDF